MVMVSPLLSACVSGTVITREAVKEVTETPEHTRRTHTQGHYLLKKGTGFRHPLLQLLLIKRPKPASSVKIDTYAQVSIQI